MLFFVLWLQAAKSYPMCEMLAKCSAKSSLTCKDLII